MAHKLKRSRFVVAWFVITVISLTGIAFFNAPQPSKVHAQSQHWSAPALTMLLSAGSLRCCTGELSSSRHHRTNIQISSSLAYSNVLLISLINFS